MNEKKKKRPSKAYIISFEKCSMNHQHKVHKLCIFSFLSFSHSQETIRIEFIKEIREVNIASLDSSSNYPSIGEKQSAPGKHYIIRIRFI